MSSGRFFRGDGLHLMLALTVFVYSVSSIQLTLGFNRSFILNTRLTLENQNLVRELRIQKEAAEQANIAKSKFIATASHDLRQPVHALGLLAGALQGHSMNEEMRRLVGQIGGSVTAMDGLFNSLLDISRLDAGVVETQIEDFPIQPLLERVCRDYLAEAETKGLRLVWSRCSAIVRTDPFLLERILRNLVSNAVRYTDRGRIVVGCRRGNRLRIEVWDTGTRHPARPTTRSLPRVLSAAAILSATARRGLVSGSRLSTGSRSCLIALSRCAPRPERGLCSRSASRWPKDSVSARRALRGRQCSRCLAG